MKNKNAARSKMNIIVAMVLAMMLIIGTVPVYAGSVTGNHVQIIDDLAPAVVAEKNSTTTLSVTALHMPPITGHDLTFTWYLNGAVIATSASPVSTNLPGSGAVSWDASEPHKLTIKDNGGSDHIGVYQVAIGCSDAACAVNTSMAFSNPCNYSVSSGESSISTPTTPQGGSLYVTGYTVQNAAGGEIQTIGVGQKAQIIIGLRDSRFSQVPAKMDAYGNIANIKITSTDTFATPSFGDINITTPRIVNGELEYAIIFNDIMYKGGDNTLAFDVAYQDNSVAMQNITVGISQCQDPAEVKGASPTVMLSSLSYGEASVEAGSVFTLSVTSYNTSSTQSLSDIKTSITLSEKITLAGASNITLHPSVGPNGSYTETFTLQAQNSAETGIENLTIDYSYYIQGTDEMLTSSQMIAIPIVQPDRFEFTGVDIDPEIYVGQEGSISVGFVNKGKGILYNLAAEITGNINEPGQYQYIGNLDSGTENSADFFLVSDTADPVQGQIIITYEDINGTQQTKTQDYSYVPIDMGMYEDDMGFDDDFMDEDMYDMDGQSAGMPWWGWLIVGVVIIGTTVVVIVVVKKKKAKKIAQQLEDEDDDDEDF